MYVEYAFSFKSFVEYGNSLMNNTTSEIWSPIIYNNIIRDMYEVSNLGRIRNSRTGHMMTPTPSEKGYMLVSFRCYTTDSERIKTSSIKIHRIVASTFVSGRSEINNEVNHKDGDKNNNRADNLEWISHLENIRHGYRNNLIPVLRGDRHGNSSHSEIDIDIICKYLVKHYGSCKSALDDIINNETIDCTLKYIYRIKYKKTGKHISDKYFTEDSFK